ncbi:MAG: c-type cytochrome [Gemmatimonadota bacterium]
MTWATAALVLAVAAGCAPADDGTQDAAGSKEAPEARAVAGGGAAAPVADAESAARGEALFRSRGCVACHTVGGGRLVGPDLQGVTERREPKWIVAMITNPDSMIQNDPTAKDLFAQFMTPMANQNVSQAEARDLWAYLAGAGGVEDAGP